MALKYRELLAYIESLPQGERISVRKIAQSKNVSQGTAYRAIKEAEDKGLVKTILRVGTIRLDDALARKIEELTFAEVQHIVEGEILGGAEGLDKTLKSFLIAAMELEDAAKYIESGHLVIVGNRLNIQNYALTNNAPVLITGGFAATKEIIALANQKKLPVISTAYDTFTTASLINRAINERMVQKKILLVEDILITEVHVLCHKDLVAQWYSLLRNTGHTRFPVVDEAHKVVGMITAKNIAEAKENQKIQSVMSQNPITIHPKTSIAQASHQMLSRGIELLPVVDESDYLLGIITREDVIGAFHRLQKQPQMGEAWEDRILNSLKITYQQKHVCLEGEVKGFMLNQLGVMSSGVLSFIFCHLGGISAQSIIKVRGEVGNIHLHFLQPLPLNKKFYLRASILESGKQGSLLEMKLFLAGEPNLAGFASAWVKQGM